MSLSSEQVTDGADLRGAFEHLRMHDHVESLRHIAVEQGVFLRHEAIAEGFDDKALRRALRTGELVRVRHGAYTFADFWSNASDSERLVIRTHAVMRVTTGRVAASHHSACALHGMDLWDVDYETAHVTRLDGGAGRNESGARHHEGLVLDHDEVIDVAGVKAVRPVRAALELAALAGVERGLVSVDSGLHKRLFSTDDLHAQHDLMKRWPATQHLHLVTRLADARKESVGETRAHFLLWAQGLPKPELQYEVYDGHRLAGVTDFAWPEHGLLGEFDGRVKYGRLLRPGETPGDAVFREKRREDRLRRITGFAMVRITWADLHDPVVTAGMIRALMRRVA